MRVHHLPRKAVPKSSKKTQTLSCHLNPSVLEQQRRNLLYHLWDSPSQDLLCWSSVAVPNRKLCLYVWIFIGSSLSLSTSAQNNRAATQDLWVVLCVVCRTVRNCFMPLQGVLRKPSTLQKFWTTTLSCAARADGTCSLKHLEGGRFVKAGLEA